jgi:hypothetical protein
MKAVILRGVGKACFLLLAVLALAMTVAPILKLYGVAVPGFPHLKVPQELTGQDLFGVVVSGATLFLALVTAGLAVYTRQAVIEGTRQAEIASTALAVAREQADFLQRQVAVSERQAGIAQESLEASWQPILVDVPLGKYVEDFEVFRGERLGQIDQGRVSVARTQGGALRCSVPFRNIGNGPAIIVGAGIQGDGAGPAARISRAIVAPGELTDLSFRFEADREDMNALQDSIEHNRPFSVTVGYRDQTGRKGWTSRADVVPDGAGLHHEWAVRQVALYHEGEDQPFAISGPIDASPG